MMVLPMPTDSQLSKITQMILNFLWKGKKPKIPLQILELDKEKGGLQLTNIAKHHKTLSIKWIKILENNTPMSDYVYRIINPNLQDLIWKCNLKSANISYVISEETYWSDVLCTWCKINFHHPQNEPEVTSQVIWCNLHIRIGKIIIKLLDNLNLFNARCIYVRDLLTEDYSRFLTARELSAKYVCHVSWLWYTSVLKAIPMLWKSIINMEDLLSTEKIMHETIATNKKPVLVVYNYSIDLPTDSNMLKYVRYFNKIHGVNPISITDLYCYMKMIYKITSVSKLRDFQYRLLLGKIFTNDTLYKWKIVKTEKCNLCNNAKQDNTHLFLECIKTRKIWQLIKDICPTIPNSAWNINNIICNNVHPDVNDISNLLILITKQYIFRCKCENVSPNCNCLSLDIKTHFHANSYKQKS